MEKEENIIEFRHVTKTYKLYKNDKQRLMAVFNKRIKYIPKKAVNDLSFEIKRGEAVAFLGKNGAGKSTILKIVTGVTYPTEGEVIVRGRVSALLELTAGFDKEMTGRENIYLKGQIMEVALGSNSIQDIEIFVPESTIDKAREALITVPIDDDFEEAGDEEAEGEGDMPGGEGPNADSDEADDADSDNANPDEK